MIIIIMIFMIKIMTQGKRLFVQLQTFFLTLVYIKNVCSVIATFLRPAEQKCYYCLVYFMRFHFAF